MKVYCCFTGEHNEGETLECIYSTAIPALKWLAARHAEQVDKSTARGEIGKRDNLDRPLDPTPITFDPYTGTQFSYHIFYWRVAEIDLIEE